MRIFKDNGALFFCQDNWYQQIHNSDKMLVYNCCLTARDLCGLDSGLRFVFDQQGNIQCVIILTWDYLPPSQWHDIWIKHSDRVLVPFYFLSKIDNYFLALKRFEVSQYDI
jgi:hypothetical protein